MTLTDELLRMEAEWMLKYIGHEWQADGPYCRFARSLPLVLADYLKRTRPSGKGKVADAAELKSDE